MTTPTDFSPNVRILPKENTVDPWPIITDEARAAWDEAQASDAALYPDGHAMATEWYVASWERANDKPAAEWVKAVTFSGNCLTGRCWECDWPPAACACGHHRPGGRAPYGPVKPADPLPAVAAFLGIAKPEAPEPVAEPDPGAHPYPAPEAEPVAEEPAPVAEPEPAAGEPAPATDATAVLLSMAKPEEEGEPAAPEATAVMPVAEEETQIVPAVKDGGESDAS